jgi:hypothetical protein
MHPSGMWLVPTKERGTARILFPAPLSACNRLVYSYTVSLLVESALYLWRRVGQRQRTANALLRMFMASESPPHRNVTCKGEEDVGKRIGSSKQDLGYDILYFSCSNHL